MAVAIGAGVAFLIGRIRLQDVQGKFATKVFQVDGAMDISGAGRGQEIFEDFDALTGCATIRADIGGHLVTGMNTVPSGDPFSRVSDLAVLTFQQVNPINAAKTVTKIFAIPAPRGAIVATDNTLVTAASGTGTLPARLQRLIDNLAASLVYVAADASITVGGWTFVASKSGLA